MITLPDKYLISLDLETGGIEVGKHVPLSIGAIAVYPERKFSRIKKCFSVDRLKKIEHFYVQLEWDDLVVTPEAMKINGLNLAHPPGPHKSVLEHSLPAEEALASFRTWLDAQCVTKVKVLGMNVGSFDLPMLKSIWGDHPWPFDYRSVDLNTLFHTLSVLQNKSFGAIKKEISDIAWENIADSDQYKHHALIDALFNIFAWKECLRRLEDGYEEYC